MREIDVDVLLEHYEGEESWTATVPLIDNCVAEGLTREQAKAAVKPQIEYFIRTQPELLEDLEMNPEFELAKVTIQVEPPEERPDHARNNNRN